MKYKYVGYNKVELAFIASGGSDTKNPRCKAVEAPSFCMSVNKYWWLNTITYASEFLA